MTTDADLFRMLRAIMRVVDRHAEAKIAGSGVLQVPMLALELKELRSSIEPFWPKYKELERLVRKRLDEITEGAAPTGDEVEIRKAAYAALSRS